MDKQEVLELDLGFRLIGPPKAKFVLVVVHFYFRIKQELSEIREKRKTA